MILLSNVIKRQAVIERQERTLVQVRTNQEKPAIVPDTFYEEQMAEGHAELERLRQAMLLDFEQRQQQFEQERLQALEEARQQGYQAGFETGHAEGQATFEEQIAKTNSFADRLEEQSQERLMRLEHELCVLGLQVTHQFLEKLHDEEEEALYQLLHQLIIQFRDREKIIIYASPTDFERVVLLEERLQGVLGANATIQLRFDPALKARDYRIDSENGAITGGLTSGFEALQTKINEVLHHV
ncbi:MULTISPECIES: FliH/SctL family protein [unclassified Exiguobacterium]|uniref:FliH/SctL family protein n=1 Tax=unclassified Exiguobacterium TaxID=2644629 RepID=UPI001BE730A1|nr:MULTISPECIES: FliH/SctL family protein [unclassified Exiguobacterium]